MVVDGDAVLGVGDVGDLGVEQESIIVLFEECRSFAIDDGAVAAGVDDEVVLVAELVESEVIASSAKNERRLLRRETSLPV